MRHEGGPPQAASAGKNLIATGTQDSNLPPAEAIEPDDDLFDWPIEEPDPNRDLSTEVCGCVGGWPR